MRVRFKKDSSKNDTMYEGTKHEFTYVSMGYGFSTNIKNCINWDDTPEGDLVEADVRDVYMMSAVHYVEHKRENNWITPKILKK
jgi:hypothetical protein